MADEPIDRENWIKAEARAVGFDLVGIAPVEPSRRERYIRDWFAAGRIGTMAWMSRHLDAKLDVRSYMPEARSMICVAINYHYPLAEARDGGARGRIARYALGDDYHEVFKARLHRLADTIRGRHPEILTRCCCDTAPVLEREYAASAGIGWIGKNTCVIHPKMGSWLLLGEVIVSADLKPDEPTSDHCGTCRRCIDACPTGAIVGPYQLDPTKCISYMNIEHRGELDKTQRASLGGWLFGCDICQEVCPYNRKAPQSAAEEFRPRFPEGSIELERIAGLDEQAYRQLFRKSAIRRAKLPILQTNADSLAR